MIFSSKISGYVRVSVRGEGCESLLNRLAEIDISLWDIRAVGEEVQFSVSPSELSVVRREAHNFRCFVSIHHRGGFSFAKKYLRDHMQLMGAAVFVFLLLLAALSFTWNVEIIAEDGAVLSEQQESEILQAAEDCGLRVPLLKAAVNEKEKALAISERCPFLSWVGISPDGVTLTIHVALRNEEERETAKHGHVVAKKNGKIRKIFVLKGQKAVEVGEEVKAGDVLISGDLVYEEEGKEPVYGITAAKGTVTASVFYEGVAYVPLERVEYSPTGKTAGIARVKGHGIQFVLWGSETDPFPHSVTEERSFSCLGWTIASKTYGEAVPHKRKTDPADALLLAEKAAGKIAKEQMNAGSILIHRKKEELHDKEGAVGIRIVLECEEEIGKFTPLP